MKKNLIKTLNFNSGGANLLIFFRCPDVEFDQLMFLSNRN